MGVHGADARRLAARVEGAGVAAGGMVAAEHGRAPAPAAAADDPTVVLDGEVGPVGDQLAVDAHDLERRLEARVGEIGTDQPADRQRHQLAQLGQIVRRRQAMREGRHGAFLCRPDRPRQISGAGARVMADDSRRRRSRGAGW
jgi:Spy/CpxP family protein refolding chaperone